MNGKYLYIFLITILLLPLNFAELQPAFLDQNAHYLGETIDLGLSGLIENEPNLVTVIIEYSNNQVYLTMDINLDEQSDLEITIPEQIYDNKLKISYKFTENENYNKYYNLDFEPKPIDTPLDFCVKQECHNRDLVFFENEDVLITTKNANTKYTLFIKSDAGILEYFENEELPQTINLPSGEYSVYGYLIFNEAKFKINNINFSIIKNVTETKKTWKSYFSEINDPQKEFDGAIIQTETEQRQPTTFENIEESKKTNYGLYAVIGIIIIALLFLIFFKTRKDKKEAKENRRTSRTSRAILLFVAFLCILNFITALSIQEKRGEYRQLEIDYDTFSNLFKYPKNVYLSIDETKLSDTVLIPISATGLSDIENIIPQTDSETGFSTELLPVLFSKNINLINLEEYRLPVTGCEQVLYWYDENPITSDPNTIINRQRTKLQENIVINSENTTTQVNTNNCISDLLQKGYLVEKRILLKTTYTTNNIDNKTALFTKLKFTRKGEDVTTSSFLGNDLNHIEVMVDFFNSPITEQTVVLSGIAQNRIPKEIAPDVTQTNIINLTEQDNVGFVISAQILDLELPNSAFGTEMNFGNELGDYRFGGSKLYISNSNFRDLKRELLKNISLSGTIRMRGGVPNISFNEDSKRILAELKLNPLKYLVLKENNIINISNNAALGITIPAGIIIEENTQYTLFLEPDKILELPTENQNVHISLVNSVFQKIAKLKDLEKTQHVLKLLYILNFKYQNTVGINSSADLYFKAHSKIIEQIHNAYTSDFEKNLIYNQFQSLTWFVCIQSIDETPKESCLSRDNVFILNYGILENITTPEKIHKNTIFKRQVSISRMYYNPYLASKNLNSRPAVLLVNSGIEQYFNKKHLPVGTLAENVVISGDASQREKRIDTEVATELKSAIYSILSDNNVTNQNLAYYKDLMSVPFHRVAFEQKGCWQEEREITSENFSNELCIYNYNIRRGTYGTVTNLDNFYTGSNYQGYELLSEEYKFVAINAYKALLLIEDISEIDNSGRPVYNSNSFTFKKMRIMVSLMELYNLYGMHTEALMQSQKLNNIFELNKRKLNESLTRTEVAAIQTQIESINKLILKNTATKLKNTLIADKTYRITAYTEIGETSWDRYKTKVTQGESHSFWSDQLAFWLTGGYINSTYRSIFERPLEEVKRIETENYNKLINGAKCLEKYIELDWTNSEITVFVNTGFAPRGKRTTLLDRSWSDEQYCRRDLQELLDYKFYEDAANIINYSKVGQTRTPIYDYLTPNYSAAGFRLDIDDQIQLTETTAYLKQIKEDYEPNWTETVLRNIDEGINPLSIVITIATAGLTVGFNVPVSSVAKSVNVLAKTVGQRIVYELGENVVVDGALGTYIYYAKPKNPAVLIMVGLLIGGSINKIGNVAFAFKQIDTVADSLADTIRLSLNLPDTPAINQNLRNAIKNGILSEYQDQTALLLRLKQTNQIPENIFSIIGKSNIDSVDDSLITTLRNNLKQNNIRITDSQLQDILVNNQAYLMYKNTKIRELIRLKNKSIVIPESQNSIIKTNLTREIPNRFGVDYTDITKEFEDLRTFNEIDQEHFAKPGNLLYDPQGNVMGYNLEYVNGQTLADFVDSGNTLDDALYFRIKETIEKLHAQGYAHGDLNPRNILIYEGYDGFDFKIIDPVGYGRLNQITGVPGLTRQAAIDLDLEQLNRLRNLTSLEAELIRTNQIDLRNVHELQRIQQTGELVPVRRSGGNIVLGEVLEFSSDARKVNVRFTDYLNNETGYRFYDIDTETFIPVRQNDIVYVDGGGSGRVINIEPNKRVTLRKNDGSIFYADVDAIINSRSLNQGLRLSGDTSQITPQTVEPFLATRNRLPERFVSRNTSSWNGREVILVDKVNDVVLKEYLENVRILSNQNPDILSKIKAAYNLVNRTMPVYTLGNTNVADDIIDGVDIHGKVIPLGHFINSKMGVCRHKALLLKLTLDEMGIESSLVRGSQYADDGRNLGRHVWVELDLQTNKGNKIYLDPTQNKYEYFNEGQQVNGLVKDSDLDLFRIRDAPNVRFSSDRISNLQEIVTRTGRQQMVANLIGDNRYFSRVLGYSDTEVQELMRLQHLRIKNLYNNDGLLLTINSRIHANNTSAAAKSEILSILSNKNITVRTVADGTVQAKTEAIGNYATLILDNPRNPIIEIEMSAYNDPNRFFREMRHEYGAYLISLTYGGKDKIPLFLIPNSGTLSEPIYSTHYLDKFMENGYNKLFPN